MTTYLIGDIHGCYNEFFTLLKKINFNSKKDILWITGDIIARGPDSIKILYFLYYLKKSIKLVLGNHDLYFIALSLGIRCSNNSYDKKLLKLLKHTTILYLIESWLIYQPLVQFDPEKKILMTHAGITPQWDNIKLILSVAHEVKNIITNSYFNKKFFSYIYSKTKPIVNWNNNKLQGFERYNFIINAFTKMRYCYPNGELEMSSKDIPDNVILPLKPWFLFKNPIYKKYKIFFGHWSALEGKYTPYNIIGLDTGCCWGNKLTIFSLEEKKFYSIKCNKQ
ncbi:symmetrical bis(5'-nucleosyl)-tetraphosphatase [Enterobacteriaceae endosymbiont of Neohaemonia nigricornis]|uniref:symmetrical bis(5'-nucleosyl)-tetraphosphatase n=1 Tax=Enterobacteriaceae endosymbiont of Neohaemonia nigricornis TaxID=2675792 RepID=UPI00144A0FBC|nr:symmetrical bis(5'-nucleosyl)-tetraphosphatase [Enterobacteriaceae endosymbiont of Neohaemonia nigricornis]QJC30359.1 symmetrical bis(5'-nucleosyl)-tetraphosphatase [Enterobacteriaceae endosymbiont of Neohaemonia nigricornis]